jgi:hypothetical protein
VRKTRLSLPGHSRRAAITARQARDDALNRGLGLTANGIPYRSRNINPLLAIRCGVNPNSAYWDTSSLNPTSTIRQSS